MAGILRYRVSEPHITTKKAIFRTLKKAYRSELANKSKEYFQMILCAATAHNHTELINLMLADPRCDLKSMLSLPLPRPVHEEMLSRKCHLNDLRVFEKLNRDQETFERTPQWSSSSNAHRSFYHGRKMVRALEERNIQPVSVYNFQNYNDIVEMAIIPSPLFVAMDNENLPLVELFLRAGASRTLSMKSRYRKTRTSWTFNRRCCAVYVASAMEHACALDHAEMLELLIAFDSVDSIERRMTLHFACQYGAVNCIRNLLRTDEGRSVVNMYDDVLKHEQKGARLYRITERGSNVVEYKTKETRRTPLHTAMLSLRRAENVIVNLPNVVQQLISAGACVNNEDSEQQTPLDYLINAVRMMESTNVEITTDERNAIVETTRLLLEVGANPNGSRDNRPLDVLLADRSYYTTSSSTLSTFLRYALSTKEGLALKTDLVCLLLKHGAKPISRQGIPSCLAMVVKMAGELAAARNDSPRLNACRTTPERCDEMMGLLCKMCRSLLLVGCGEETERFCEENLLSLANFVFRRVFIEPANDSAKSAPIQRFVRLFLATLNASSLNQLKKDMNQEVELLIEEGNTSEEWKTFARNEVQSIDGLNGRDFLQHLARRAVIKAVTHKCLPDSISFEIPRHLNEYVLLRD